ncbi:MAG: 16S rRNA (adenine(1518)-N(6)/adenine(1519)-N(6))-dimethyltransferase RsmA [Hydrotalea sp.]|nr:16S rRNA (adenine(1518)-N(6)/adenine(1519)-N(6))-dimethyltransferase RsmA [Hydrotalea sp.]
MTIYPRPLKHYGQHFLQDANLAEKIVRLAYLPDAARVVEIGPGRGILSHAILRHSNANLLAIEKDRALEPLLKPLVDEYGARLTLSFADALAWQPQTLGDTPPHAIDVIANLPYNVGSQLLVNFCQQHIYYRQLVLMFQKEVALRIVATPGTSAFGRLSILVQTIAQAEMLFTLPPGAFFPPPKVSSAVVKIKINVAPPPCNIVHLGRLTNILFQQRRKQLHHGLAKIIGGDVARAKRVMAEVGIAERSRAEDLSVAVFWQLTKLLADDLENLGAKTS